LPKPTTAQLSVEIEWGIRTSWPAGVSTLRRTALATLEVEGFTEGNLSIAVVGKQRMARLHHEFSGIPGATDVLTFDLGTIVADQFIDGEIIVCSDIARQRSRSIKAAVRELALYTVHGILHLVGYDDHDPAEFERMHAREDELLNRLGLGRVFNGDVL